jgi:hypothetical protein
MAIPSPLASLGRVNGWAVTGRSKGVFGPAAYQWVKMLSLSVWTQRTGNGNVLSTYWATAVAVETVSSSASETSRSRVQQSIAVHW